MMVIFNGQSAILETMIGLYCILPTLQATGYNSSKSFMKKQMTNDLNQGKTYE